jgi:hypothetical protein
MRHSEVAGFLKRIEKSPPIWRSVDIRIVAAPFQGRWINLGTRLLLHHRLPSRAGGGACVPRAVPWLLMIHEHRKISQVPRLVRAIARGRLKLGWIDVEYLMDSAATNGRRAAYEPLYTLDSIPYREEPYSVPVPTEYVLRFLGPRLDTIIAAAGGDGDRARALMRASTIPPDDLGAFINSRVGLHSEGGSPEDAYAWVFAPFGAVFADPCELSEGVLRYTIRIHSPLIARHLSVAAFGPQPGQFYMHRKLEWSDHVERVRDGHEVIEGTLDVPEAESVAVLLGCGGTLIDRRRVVDRRSRELASNVGRTGR